MNATYLFLGASISLAIASVAGVTGSMPATPYSAGGLVLLFIGLAAQSK